MMANWKVKAAGAALIYAGLIAVASIAPRVISGQGGDEPQLASVAPSIAPAPVVAPAAPEPNTVDKSWKLVWQDDFEGDTLDPAKWNIEQTTPTNPGMGLDLFDPKNVRVENGLLALTVQPSEEEAGKYSSSLVETRRKAFWKHGRFEVRMKTLRGKGTKSAFWMMPNVKDVEPWPTSGEIDVAEQLGREPTQSHGTIHYPGEEYFRDHGVYNPDETLTEDLGKDFHVYAVEWRESSFEWFLDGKSYHRTTHPDMAEFPFNRAFYLILAASAGGKWTGDPSPNAVWPRTLQVDWVRVYQSDEAAAATAREPNY